MDTFTLIMIAIIAYIGVIILVAVLCRANEKIRVKSSAAVNNYDYIKYFKEDRSRIESVEHFLIIKQKKYYKLRIIYISPAGRKTRRKDIKISLSDIEYIKSNPKLLMTSSEYNQILREQRQIEKAQEKAIKEKEKAIKEKEKAEKDAEREEARRKKEEEREQLRKEKYEERVQIQKEKYAEKIQLMKEKEAIRKAYKAEQAAILKEKQQQYYDKVNEVIDYT
ncbi:MAG: hypothetical protein K5654_07880, partial [Lachnospiraceae bacterium]|nr:hypothetical protein [Lachnospiraceae bacterium]